MFKLLFVMLALSSVSVFASDVCIAEKNHSVSYGSTMRFKVLCENKEFYSSKIITGIFLPIPYRWEKKATEVLNRDMKKLGYQNKGNLNLPKPFGNFFDKFVLFDKAHSTTDYCLAFEHSFKKTGINNKVETFDVQISCTDNFNVNFNGVTEEELADYMMKNGFNKEFSKKIKPRQANAENYAVVWVEKITIFKK